MSSTEDLIGAGLRPYFTPHETYTRVEPLVSGYGGAWDASSQPLWQRQQRIRYPTVYLTEAVMELQQCYTDIASTEVGWFAVVKRIPSGDFLIDEVFLLRQNVHDQQTRTLKVGFAEFGTAQIARGAAGIEAINNLRGWTHSHGPYPTDPSERDVTQMLEFGMRSIGGGKTMPWFLQGIVNKLGRMTYTLYDFENKVRIVDLPWVVVKARDPAVQAAVAAEFADKVKQIPIPHTDYPSYAEVIAHYRPKPPPVPPAPAPADKGGDVSGIDKVIHVLLPRKKRSWARRCLRYYWIRIRRAKGAWDRRRKRMAQLRGPDSPSLGP